MSKPNPTAAILPLEDYRKDKPAASADTLQPQGGVDTLKSKIPPVPGRISDEARKHWYFIGERLVAANMLAEVDLGQFQILCQTWSLYIEAQHEVEEKGEYQETPNGYAQLAPWAVARERHASRYQKVADKFFLSPRSRQIIKQVNPNQGSLNLE